METRARILEIPRFLRETLEKGVREYETLIRHVRWGEGPIYICCCGASLPVGMAGVYLFEWLAGWPVVAHSSKVFEAYALSTVRPRSVLVVISARGEWPEAQELAREALERGCTTVGLTNTPDSPLAKLADHVFLTPAEGDAESPAAMVCLHAALNFLAFEAMRVLKKPKQWWDLVEKDFDQLPNKLDWVFTQLPSVVRSVAAEVARLPRLRIVGGGFNHYPAWHGAWRLRSLASPQVGEVEASEFLNEHAYFARRGESVLLLSGSHSKMKKLVHRGAAQTRMNGARVLSLTDSNDQELVKSSDLGIMVPSLLEMPASTLTLFMLEWLGMEALHAAKP